MSFVSGWAQGIIVAVIIASIIEMLLPNNGNGKYVKVVIGIFVLFSVISPVINKFKGKNVDVSNDIDAYIQTSSNSATTNANTSFDNNESIKLMYEENLKIDIKSKVNQKGYKVGDVKLEILNNSEYTLNKIEINITAKNEGNNTNSSSQGRTAQTTTIVENIENIKISLGGSREDSEQKQQSVISESEKRKLKEYLSSVYEVNENNIVVN